VKIVDANVLVYAVNESSRAHAVSRAWLIAALSGNEAVGLPWMNLLAFVRITTNGRLFPQPLTATAALNTVRSWLASPAAVTPEPTSRHLEVLTTMLNKVGTAGNLTMDAHLAALATEHHADIVTFDRDLQRFDVPIVIPE
jgi:toxin-antitoxin system PIN domain toxin